MAVRFLNFTSGAPFGYTPACITRARQGPEEDQEEAPLGGAILELRCWLLRTS